MSVAAIAPQRDRSLRPLVLVPDAPAPVLERGTFALDAVRSLATGDDLTSAVAHVAELVRDTSGAAGVDWWAPGSEGTLELVARAGTARGPRHEHPLGQTGVFVSHGGRLTSGISDVLNSLAPIIRRRAAEERLARTTVELARRNEALEDFAALVAHELKGPLQAALVADDPSHSIEDALDLVDALLEASRTETAGTVFASAAEALEQVAADLHSEVEITSEVLTTLPLPSGPLRVVLRNLISNGLAAGAHHVHVTAERSPHSRRLLVDDDGVGLDDAGSYSKGSGLGLALCKRIAARFGGALQLAPRPSGGTRATLEFAEVLQ